MKSLLSVTADTKAGEKEVSGETLAIRGGRPLTGRVEVKGAKNLATKAMVAALLGETTSVLRDVPDISDVQVVRSLLEVHGVTRRGRRRGRARCTSTRSGAVSAHFEEIDAHAGASRIPILFCGPLLHLLGEALIPDLGGCRIGDRPINFHMDALRAFGAIVDKSYEGIRITAPNGLHGANIELPYPSVGATEQVLLTAVKAKGVTELRNAAIEPEIMDLIAVLQKMGAIISYEPNRVILIEGVDTLQRLRPPLHLRPQRGRLVGVRRARDRRRHLRRRREAAGDADVPQRLPQGRRLRSTCTRTASASAAAAPLKPVVVETDVHPGFMTDWQQPLIVALTQAEGESVVHETVYENRLGFTEALVQMGADIVVHPQGIDSPDRRVPAARARAGRRHQRTRRRCTAPTSWCPTSAAATATSSRRSRPRASRSSATSGIIRRGYEKLFTKLDALGADFDVIG